MMRVIRLAQWGSLICSLGFLAMPFTASAAIGADVLMPLAEGATWEVRLNGGTILTLNVLAETAYVNGRLTHVIEMTGGPLDGAREFVTNDENGARLHRLSYVDLYVPGLGVVDTRITLNPPALLLNTSVEIGDEVESTGQGAMYYEDYGTVSLSYSSSAHVVGYEEVAVPYGTFEALKLTNQLTISSDTPGETETETSEVWLLPGVGEIKSITTSSLGVDTLELVDTNLVPLPEPTAALAQLAAIVTLVAWRSGKKRTLSAPLNPCAGDL